MCCKLIIYCPTCFSPNSITLTFTETSLRGKLWTQITKVADTNHLDMSRCLRQSPWQVRNKHVCVALMEFSPLQCTGKVDDKVGNKIRDKFPTKLRTCRGHKSWKSATWYDLCPWLCRNLSRTLLQSRRNGIWAFPDLFQVVTWCILHFQTGADLSRLYV